MNYDLTIIVLIALIIGLLIFLSGEVRELSERVKYLEERNED